MMMEGATVANQDNMPDTDLAIAGPEQSAPEQALACMIVSVLQLEVEPGAIEPEARLFVDGLGLDSIDALELALAISRAHGFELRSDDARNQQIFRSLRSLAAHIEAHRTR